MSVNPSTVNTIPWQAVDVNSTAQTIIDGPAHVQYCKLDNHDNAVRYAHFYNVLAADVVVGTTPSYFIEVPANGQVIIDIPQGIFYNGVALSISA